jgi:hypothetical protein
MAVSRAVVREAERIRPLGLRAVQDIVSRLSAGPYTPFADLALIERVTGRTHPDSGGTATAVDPAVLALVDIVWSRPTSQQLAMASEGLRWLAPPSHAVPAMIENLLVASEQGANPLQVERMVDGIGEMSDHHIDPVHMRQALRDAIRQGRDGHIEHARQLVRALVLTPGGIDETAGILDYPGAEYANYAVDAIAEDVVRHPGRWAPLAGRLRSSPDRHPTVDTIRQAITNDERVVRNLEGLQSRFPESAAPHVYGLANLRLTQPATQIAKDALRGDTDGDLRFLRLEAALDMLVRNAIDLADARTIAPLAEILTSDSPLLFNTHRATAAVGLYALAPRQREARIALGSAAAREVITGVRPELLDELLNEQRAEASSGAAPAGRRPVLDASAVTALASLETSPLLDLLLHSDSPLAERILSAQLLAPKAKQLTGGEVHMIGARLPWIPSADRQVGMGVTLDEAVLDLLVAVDSGESRSVMHNYLTQDVQYIGRRLRRLAAERADVDDVVSALFDAERPFEVQALGLRRVADFGPEVNLPALHEVENDALRLEGNTFNG